MRPTAWTWLGVLGALAPLGGCSAIVRELEVTCENDCKALNEHAGLGDDDCYIYQCRSDKKGCEIRARDKDGDRVPDERTCGDAGVEYDGALDCDDDAGERHPDAGEECNGLDDNCDGVIDEGALDGSFAAESELMLSDSERVASGASADGLLHLALRVPAEKRDTLALRKDAYTNVEIRKNCQAETETTFKDCEFDRIVIAATATTVVAAGVNTNGCGTGQVRLGASLDRETFTWEHAAGSALRLGVDSWMSDKGTVCEPWGVSQLSAALLSQSDVSQGLLLWRESVPGLLVPAPGRLRGIAFDLAFEQGRQRVTTPNMAHSEVVSEAFGLDPAAMASWPASRAGGYFIAHDTPDSIELAFVPRSPASRALGERLHRGRRIQTHAPRNIVLALDAEAQAADALGLAVAWHDGNQLQFAPLTYDPQADSVLHAGDTVHVADAAELRDGPVLVYQRDGFRSVPDAAPGGWYVLWLEQKASGTRVLGSRVAQSNFAVEEPFLVSEGAQVGTLFAYPNEGRPQLAYVAGEERPELYIGSLGCQPQP